MVGFKCLRCRASGWVFLEIHGPVWEFQTSLQNITEELVRFMLRGA